MLGWAWTSSGGGGDREQGAGRGAQPGEERWGTRLGPVGLHLPSSCFPPQEGGVLIAGARHPALRFSMWKNSVGPRHVPSPRPWHVWPPGRSAQGEAGKMVRMMRFNEKRCTIWKSRGQRGVRPPSGQSLVGGSALRHGATTAGSSGLGLVATDPGIGPLWLCPRVLQAGAEPASG